MAAEMNRPPGLTKSKAKAEPAPGCTPGATPDSIQRSQISQINFATRFRNSLGVEVAGTWFERESGSWRISTLALHKFDTEQAAVRFFQIYCDTETGLQRTSRHPMSQLIDQLREEGSKSAVLQQQTKGLLRDISHIIKKHREDVGRICGAHHKTSIPPDAEP